MPKPTKIQMRARRDAAIAAANAARAAADPPAPDDPVDLLPAGPAPAKRGRPAHEVTEANRQVVAVLTSIKTPHEVIAMMLDVSIDTLKKWYRPELNHGYERTKAAVAFSMIRKAIGGDVPAGKFFLQCFGGPEWRVTEHRIIDGHIDLTDAATDELERRRAELERLRADGDRARALEASLPDAIH